MRTARNEDIEIRVDLERPEKTIEYKTIGGDWTTTPFQSADVINETEALLLVDDWLESSYGQG